MALLGQPQEPSLRAVTERVYLQPEPKFVVLNRLLQHVNISDYDFIVITDDDFTVPKGFLDAYLSAQLRYGFALEQPARSWHCFHDPKITLRKPWLKARQTRFVEIGPVFSCVPKAANKLLPFDESSGMGWGYDVVWPMVQEQLGLSLGIVDAVSVDHSHRPQGAAYSQQVHRDIMVDYLQKIPI